MNKQVLRILEILGLCGIVPSGAIDLSHVLPLISDL